MDLLHGEVRVDQAVVATWEAQPVEATDHLQVWEYAVDVSDEGVEDRFTGTFTMAITAPEIKVAALVLTKAGDYL